MKAFLAIDRETHEIRDIPIPEIGDRDILIQMKAAAICGSDVHIYDGSMDPLCGYPVIMGHENAGVIVKIGKDAPGDWKVGDRVTSENTVTVCGKCYSCMTGEYVACEERTGFGVAADGCFAEYIKISGDILSFAPQCLMKIPDNLSFEEAVLLEPAANAYKSVIQEGGLIAGENILIAGAGTFGTYCAHMASIGGAAKVVMLIRRSTIPEKIEIAKKMGVTDFIYSDDDAEARAEAARLTDGFGFDLAIETTTSPHILNYCIETLHTHGRCVRIAIGGKPYNYSMDSITLRSIKLMGHLGYNPISWRNVMNLSAAGKVDLKTPVTHVFPLEQTDEGFKVMCSRQAEKVIIKIGE